MKSMNYVLVFLCGFMIVEDALTLELSTLPEEKENVELREGAGKHEPCSTFQLNFPRENHTAFAVLHNTIDSDLDAISICHWSRVLNPDSEFLSVISYRSSDRGNEIWTGFGGGKVYFQRYDTFPGHAHNIRVGEWTHNCFTWSSDDGEMAFYENGVQIFQTTGVAAKRTIPPAGLFFLGQEGNLDSKWSFKGDITEVHVWDYVISQEEVTKMFDYSFELEGNIISWRSDIVLELKNGATMSPAYPCIRIDFV